MPRPKSEKPKIRAYYRLRPEIDEKLRELMRSESRTATAIVERAIGEYYERHSERVADNRPSASEEVPQAEEQERQSGANLVHSPLFQELVDAWLRHRELQRALFEQVNSSLPKVDDHDFLARALVIESLRIADLKLRLAWDGRDGPATPKRDTEFSHGLGVAHYEDLLLRREQVREFLNEGGRDPQYNRSNYYAKLLQIYDEIIEDTKNRLSKTEAESGSAPTSRRSRSAKK